MHTERLDAIGTIDATRDGLVDAVLGASRALVAVAARSLAGVDGDVTLAQYRVLVELAARGPLSLDPPLFGGGVVRATDLNDLLSRQKAVVSSDGGPALGGHLYGARAAGRDEGGV
jgi:hypothetical protein